MSDIHDHSPVYPPNAVEHKSKGSLTIFVAASPGAGKTYAMLAAAKERMQQGDAVLIGWIDTYGSAETASLADGMERLPSKRRNYQGQTFEEFDLDAAVGRQPTLLLLDQLEHTNLPGSRHTWRYQDVAELLAAGIDVYSTLDIQHLASLNDAIWQIIGIRIDETVPDQIIDHADELVFVDVPPNQLIERYRQGIVHIPRYLSGTAVDFFSPPTLTALRELALREVIERVDARLNAELGGDSRNLDFVINEKLLVLVSHRSDHEYLIRLGRQIADRRKIPWLVVWVDTGQPRYQKDSARLQAALALAKDLGAKTEILRGPSTYQTILPYIAQQRVNTVLVGAGKRRKLFPWRKSLYQRLIESGLPIEVSVFREYESAGDVKQIADPDIGLLGNRAGHVFSIAGVLLATAIAVLLENWLSNANLVLVYVLAVMITGLKHGSVPAMLASVLAFLSFNFFLTEPRHSFEVHRQDELSTLLFLFMIALVSGPAASRIRRQFILLREANRYSESMRLLGRALSVAEDDKAVWEALAEQLRNVLQTECRVVMPDGDKPYSTFPKSSLAFAPIDDSAIEWSLQHAEPSGRFTETLAASNWTVFPITKDDKTIAAVAIRFDSKVSALRSDDKELIATMLRQAADTWRRIQLVGELESARVKTEVEQLRSSLLSSVSHDLKSPLSAMMGAADSMRLLDRQLSAQDRSELVDTILSESRRLESYIQNLLDMTRLGHGSLKIERDWVSLTDIVGSAIMRLKRVFPAVTTEYHEKSPLPLLFAHAALIEQALFNILENAAKFSPPGEKIRISAERKNDACLVAVEDRGPGVPEPLREKIFDMFYVVSEGDRKQPSTGLGLAICRGMIGAHGGTVKALEGTGRQGTRIEVELPIAYPGRTKDNN